MTVILTVLWLLFRARCFWSSMVCLAFTKQEPVRVVNVIKFLLGLQTDGLIIDYVFRSMNVISAMWYFHE